MYVLPTPAGPVISVDWCSCSQRPSTRVRIRERSNPRGVERQLSVLEAPRETPTLPAAPFLIGEETQALVKRERMDLRVMELRFIRLRHPAQLQLAERLERLVREHQCTSPLSVK
jgi:hypothetical protein